MWVQSWLPTVLAGPLIDDQQPELGALTSWAAWWQWRDKVVARYREQGENCPLHTAVSQLGTATGAARAVARELLQVLPASVQVVAS
ncbi:hypothetical protein ACH4U6_20110 [Streptomyces netropsis]|uniref:hypothetical protein n=1 Tax=Streptomyces netropsis TaxID=55404 RepID=UPI00378E006C